TPTGTPSAPSTADAADRSCETSSPPTSAAPAPNRPESPAPRKTPRPTPRPGLDRPRRRKRRPGLRAPRVGEAREHFASNGTHEGNTQPSEKNRKKGGRAPALQIGRASGRERMEAAVERGAPGSTET